MKNYNIYSDMLNQTHLLIAGKTGSGKSVVINGMICEGLKKGPKEVEFILIDPKRVELAEYRNMPHCIKYASEPEDMVGALEYAMTLTDLRYKHMQVMGVKKHTGSDVYVIIDELADLMTTNAKQVAPLIQRLCQIGRAAKIHVIAATQCPLATVIPTTIKVNFDSRVALKTVTAQHSRNIMDATGCEKLPPYGKAYYITPKGSDIVGIPMMEDDEREAIKARWKVARKPEPRRVERKPERKGFFKRLFA